MPRSGGGSSPARPASKFGGESLWVGASREPRAGEGLRRGRGPPRGAGAWVCGGISLRGVSPAGAGGGSLLRPPLALRGPGGPAAEGRLRSGRGRGLRLGLGSPGLRSVPQKLRGAPSPPLWHRARQRSTEGPTSPLPSPPPRFAYTGGIGHSGHVSKIKNWLVLPVWF